MVDIITAGEFVITPDLVLGYESRRPSRTVTHDIINVAGPDATLRPAGLRIGRMTLGFFGEDAEERSAHAEEVLAGAATFNLQSSDRLTIRMAFVLPDTGEIRRTLDEVTRDDWTVAFDWREVAS